MVEPSAPRQPPATGHTDRKSSALVRPGSLLLVLLTTSLAVADTGSGLSRGTSNRVHESAVGSNSIASVEQDLQCTLGSL